MTPMTTRPTKEEINKAEQELSSLWTHLSRDFQIEALTTAYDKLHERSALAYKLLMIAEGIHYKELEALGITPPRARSTISNFDHHFVQNAQRICTSLCIGMRNGLDALEATQAQGPKR
jgi:hypothetical protein